MTDAIPGILAIFNNVAPGREADFEQWFQHEHLAERIGVPGFLLGRRHEAVSGEPRYFNLYLTQSADVLDGRGVEEFSQQIFVKRAFQFGALTGGRT